MWFIPLGSTQNFRFPPEYAVYYLLLNEKVNIYDNKGMNMKYEAE